MGGRDDVEFDLERNSAPWELSLDPAVRLLLATAIVRRLPTTSPPEDDDSVIGVVLAVWLVEDMRPAAYG